MAMDFKRAAARVRGLLAPSRPQDLSKSALTEDLLRDNIVAEAGERSEHYKRAVQKRPTLSREDGEEFEWETFPEAVRDYARASFGWDEPELRPADQVRPSYRLNHAVEQGAFSSGHFQEQRPHSRNNMAESVVGAAAFADKLEQIGQERLGEHIDRSQQLSNVEQEQQDAEEMMEWLREAAKRDVAKFGTVQDDVRRGIKQALRRLEQAQATLGQLTHEQAASNVVLHGLAAGQDAAGAAQEAVDGFGMIPGIGGGEAHNLDLDEQIELAKLWSANPLLLQVVRMLGRMLRSMVMKRNARISNVPQIPVGVKTGDDLERMLPLELARAMAPNTLVRSLWMIDYAARSLLVRKMEGEQPAGKGPVITVHDGSGSMAGPRFVWATALCLAVLTIANRERRQFAGVEFGSAGQIKRWLFPAGETPDARMVLDYATHFFAGGTSTLSGMHEALKVMREHPEFEKADVLLIGDGADYFRDADRQVRDELRALGCRIHGISILTPNNAYMQEMCEYVVDVADLSGRNDATDKVAVALT